MDWLDAAWQRAQGARIGTQLEEIGRVVSVADGVAMVSGLPQARLDERLEFEDGQVGFVHSLEVDHLACVMLDETIAVRAGQAVRGRGQVIQVPVGESLLGRVVDPLGRPLDGGPVPHGTQTHPIERAAPAIVDRAAVAEPVQTGLLVVDAMFALGRGQRELILGDRGTGKTSVAVEAICNQRATDMVCIYVAIGQKSSTVARVIEQVRAHGAPQRCIFVIASPASAPGLQWIAPFAAMTMAEYFRDRGGHALVVFDDLTQHAATHREIALLTGQSPGREAYPGDVFFLHSRLLERAARLAPQLGGGSLTALPIAQTDAGNISAYIPTNLISITDGQLVLNQHLFAEGHTPAVDVGTSVSRVGGKTQWRALRDATGTMRLAYAQFLELELFTRFGERPDPRVKSQIERGQRLRVLLAQGQFEPLRVVDQVALAIAWDHGLMDPLPVADVQELRARVPAWIDARLPDLGAAVLGPHALQADQVEAIRAAMAALVASLPAPSSAPASVPKGAGDAA